MARWGVVALILPVVAGCIDNMNPAYEEEASDAQAYPSWPFFTEPILLDAARAGGEPVIAITSEGTLLVSAHPGYTHIHPDTEGVPPGGPEAVVPTQAQSYLWRSTNGGASWDAVSLLPVGGFQNSGPRGLGLGISDPDFTVDGNGRVWMTDLLFAEASVSWSDDDGKTWIWGNNAASQGVVDRQWLASHGDTLYFTANYFSDRRVLATQDGLVYERRGSIPDACGGDFVASPLNGHLIAGCGTGIAASTDAGSTWAFKTAGLRRGASIENEPAIDAAGTVYLSNPGPESPLALAWTTDEGASWARLELGPYFPELASGVYLWPWTSAGSPGRVSVTFFGSPTPDATRSEEAAWYVYNAIVINATSEDPEVYAVRLTPEPFHVGPICRSGTRCQASTAVSDLGDRRLGDFFETTIDRDGFLHVVYADTQDRPHDAVSHAAYVRQIGGPRLVEGSLPPGFPTQG